MIQARWGTDELVVADDDPFADRVEQVGLPIQLNRDEAELNVALVELVRREGLLYEAGVRCAVKDRDDTSCHACAISAHDDKNDPLHPLCLLGREQEQVVTDIAIAREARRASGEAGR